MKKSSRKKSAAKQPSAPTSAGTVKGGLVAKQPQVKEEAAVKQGMFLYTDDAWSRRYFDQNDLRFKEREVFA